MSQIASAVLMVEPTSFGFDVQTAESNAFQHHISESAAQVQEAASREFAAVVKALREFGVGVTTYAHKDGVARPNAVFPNNWLTTWPDGRVYLYPMATASRRVERSDDLLLAMREQYDLQHVINISDAEKSDKFLESTGVIVFDHEAKRAYACESVRCDAGLFEEHVRGLGYEPILFQAEDSADVPVYHTNVMLGIQSGTAVLCAEAIRDEAQRARVVNSLQETGHTVVQITEEQLRAYCGNVMELSNAAGDRCLLLSQSAYDAFTPGQRAVLSAGRKLLPVAVPTIQSVGGGSVRCMVAEIFLPALVSASGAGA